MHPCSILPDPFAPQLARNEESLGILSDTFFTMFIAFDTHPHVRSKMLHFKEASHLGGLQIGITEIASFLFSSAFPAIFGALLGFHSFYEGQLYHCLCSGGNGWLVQQVKWSLWKPGRALGWSSCLCVQCSNWFHEALCVWVSAKYPKIHSYIYIIYIYMFRSFLHRHQPSVLVQQCVRAPLGTPGSVTPCLRAVHWRSPLETTFLLEQTGKYLILSAFGHVNNLECSTIDFTT